jgi:hypothetical protein
MTPKIPRIGFDRFIDIEWLSTALRVRTGESSLLDLKDALDRAGLGVAARKKTQTVLNRLWLEPRSELIGFANRGVELFKNNSGCSAAILSWGMAIATYPFFGHVAELVGRLSSLQGDCASAEIHRRMSEVYGEREGTYRMTNMVLQSQSNWGALNRVDNDRRLIRSKPVIVADESAVAWLVEAVVRFKGKPVSLPLLQSMPVIYPFQLDQSLAYVASKSSTLEVRSEASSERFVALHHSQ